MSLLDQAVVSVSEVIRYLETDRYLDKPAAAEYLGIGLRTFEGWMDQLPKYRPGGKALFRKSELDAFMQRHREQPRGGTLNDIVDDVVTSILK